MTLNPLPDLGALKTQQRQLATRVVPKEETFLDIPNLRAITGLDVAYSGATGIAGAVTLDIHTKKILEMKTSIIQVEFPYIPGFLSYRELPAILSVFKQLTHPPEVFLIDGHGIAHPRGLGLASHFGLEVGQPTIGVAKKRLVGEPEFWPERPGEWAKLIYAERPVGAVFRPKKTGKPIFISIGHLISLPTAIEVVKRVLVPQQRIPEPIRLADQLTRRKKKEFEGKMRNSKGGRLLPRESLKRFYAQRRTPVRSKNKLEE